MRLTKLIFSALAGIFLLTSFCYGSKRPPMITLESLLQEMISVEELARFPDPYYTTHQESSYDRRSVTPHQPEWFANDDGFGVMRVDTTGGRIERVMMDEVGAGVITRIWITTVDKRGVWRFYFDGSPQPSWEIPAYDLMRFDVAGIGLGLRQPHTSYTADGRGGNTLFLPIPYSKGCKITFEDGAGVNPTPKYYGINFRRYPPNTPIETLTVQVLKRAEKSIAHVDNLLLNPQVERSGKIVAGRESLSANDSLTIMLPKGENGVYELRVKVKVKEGENFAQLMREIILTASFDGKQTVWVPLGDFSGGGMGAVKVKSWYLDSDGEGGVVCRWFMPYKKSGVVKLINISNSVVDVAIQANVSQVAWDSRSLYFHSSWREQTQIPLHKYDDPQNCADWNFATIQGRGIYKGDLLSLFNHSPRWYGEGDEKIWVDNDTFPSHFGTGTEDYYNSSWAPVVPFYTPFGGAPRADNDSSHGYNAFLRTRNLDGITFCEQLKFDIEMMSWEKGSVDYSTTIYWYGDYNSRALGTSDQTQARRELLVEP